MKSTTWSRNCPLQRLDGLTARLIKASSESIIPPLLHIFNLSLSSGVFPSMWKVARVTPLYKDGCRSDKNNYRPISVLPVLSKLLERLVHDRLYTYVTNANILNDRQSEFGKKHPTRACLLEFPNVIYGNIENCNLSGVFFMDIQRRCKQWRLWAGSK